MTYSTALTEDLDDTSTDLYVVAAPTAYSPDYFLTVGSEAMRLNSVQTDFVTITHPTPRIRLSVQRGVVGTTRASHSSGDAVTGAGGSKATLADVLAAGNDVGGNAITSDNGSSLNLARSNHRTDLVAGDGAAAENGGALTLAGGSGDDGEASPADLVLEGGHSSGLGASTTLEAGYAVTGSGMAGGDVTLIPGGGDGAGRQGQVFLNLPTSDPGVAGALWADTLVVKVSAG